MLPKLHVVKRAASRVGSTWDDHESDDFDSFVDDKNKNKKDCDAHGVQEGLSLAFHSGEDILDGIAHDTNAVPKEMGTNHPKVVTKSTLQVFLLG